MARLTTLSSIRAAGILTVALSVLIASNAFAQNSSLPSPADTASPATVAANQTAPMAEVGRVIVTGSNIPTAEEVGPHPVDTYRKDDIIRLGVRSSTELVQKLPAATGSTMNENQTNGGDGRAEINLRGIIAKETLVMQDGRRLAPVGFAGATVDLNIFPIGLIDHVDILKDGASAIYGSDAVGGVVNFWLIHKFRGLELYVTYGNTNLGFANDMGEERAYLLAGTGDDKTDIVVYAEVYNRAGLASRDTNLSHDPDAVAWGGGDFRSSSFAGRVQGFVYQPDLNNGSRTPTPHAFPNVQSDPEYVPRLSLPREKQLFNFADITPSIAAVDREYLYGSLDRKICDQYLELFADFKYARTAWNSSLAPTPFADPFTDAAHFIGISSGGISVPIQNAFNPFTVADYTSPGGFDPRFPQTQASAPPPGTQFTTGVRYRGLEAGLRTDKVTTDNYEFTAGLKGNLGEFGNYLKTWDWETGFRYNEDYRFERFGGIVNSNAFRTALLATNPATAFNPFGINQNTKAVIDKVFVTTNHVGTTTLELEDAKLTGDLFSIPGGPVSFAIGGEHRREHTSDNPDALSASGQTLGSINFGPTNGGRDVWSAYWEVRVPVTSPAWNFPGLYSLELDYQERYENFSDFGSTERPKFSARWQPIDSALTIRATYNEAFHAPALGELFSAGVTDFVPGIFDPVTGQLASPQKLVTGNPNLKPETAYEWTYGAIVTPGKWWSPLQGLTLGADFYHIDLRAIALRPSPQFIVFHEAEFPGQVIRDPTDNTILLIIDPQANLGSFIEEGWDYEVVYTFETSRLGHGDLGALTATLNWTYLDRAVRQEVPNGPSEVVVGKAFGGFFGGPLTHNRWYASLFYGGAPGTSLGGLETGFTVHFIGQYWDDYFSTFFDPHPRNPNDPNSLPIGFSDRKIREWITLDWILSYTFSLAAPAAQNEVAGYAKDGGKNVKMKDGKDKNVMPVSTAQYNPCGWRAWLNNTTVTIGMNNVFDEEPPFVAGYVGLNSYDEQTANPRGRIWYVALTKRF